MKKSLYRADTKNKGESMVRSRVEALIVLISVLSFANPVPAEELPEFFGCYIKTISGAPKELAKTSRIYSTGWMVSQKRAPVNDIKSAQKMFETGGDLGAAFSAMQNTKPFLVDISDSVVGTTDANGFILYGDFDVNNVIVARLRNNAIPSDATLVSYQGPQPPDYSKMWFLESALDHRSKPLKEKMYFVQTREKLTSGCYVIRVGAEYYDFEVKGGTGAVNPLVGAWAGMQIYKAKGLFGSNIVKHFDIVIDSVDSDGRVTGNYRRYADDNRKKIKDEEKIEGMTINQSTGSVIQVGNDEGKEGNLYGNMEGTLSIIKGEKCLPDVMKIKSKFIPFDKYKSHEFLKKYEIVEEMERAL